MCMNVKKIYISAKFVRTYNNSVLIFFRNAPLLKKSLVHPCIFINLPEQNTLNIIFFDKSINFIYFVLIYHALGTDSHTNTHLCIHTYLDIYIYVYMYTYICIRIYVYVHIYIYHLKITSPRIELTNKS